MYAFWRWVERPLPSARSATGFTTLVLSVLFSIVLVALLLPAMYVGAEPASVPATSADTRRDADSALIILTCLLAVGLAVCRRTREAVGLRLPPAGPLRWLAGGTALSFAALMGSGGGAMLLHSAAGVEYSGASGAQWAAMSGWERLHASLAAGLHEEFFYLAVPVGAALLAAEWAGARRTASGRWSPVTAARVRVWAVAGAGVLYLVFRVGMHAYQGVAPALGVLVWASVNLGIVLVLRSVLPLMAAHVLYDFGVAGGGVLYASPQVSLLVAAVLGGVVLAGVWAQRRTVAVHALGTRKSLPVD